MMGDHLFVLLIGLVVSSSIIARFYFYSDTAFLISMAANCFVYSSIFLGSVIFFNDRILSFVNKDVSPFPFQYAHESELWFALGVFLCTVIMFGFGGIVLNGVQTNVRKTVRSVREFESKTTPYFVIHAIILITSLCLSITWLVFAFLDWDELSIFLLWYFTVLFALTILAALLGVIATGISIAFSIKLFYLEGEFDYLPFIDLIGVFFEYLPVPAVIAVVSASILGIGEVLFRIIKNN
jgi:hypothetical protein